MGYFVITKSNSTIVKSFRFSANTIISIISKWTVSKFIKEIWKSKTKREGWNRIHSKNEYFNNVKKEEEEEERRISRNEMDKPIGRWTVDKARSKESKVTFAFVNVKIFQSLGTRFIDFLCARFPTFRGFHFHRLRSGG